MKLTSLLCVLLLLPVASHSQVQTKTGPKSPYRITGTVISSADGTPIPHAHLTATLVPRDYTGDRQFPSPIGTFDTDEHGRFTIPLPSAGMWRLVGSASGYVAEAYMEHQSFSSGIVLTAAVPTMDLRFQLSPEAIITGTVLDEAGEAVRNARVSLLAVPPVGPDSIQHTARARMSTTTDDRGMYEFDGLSPGDYRLKVQGQVWYAVAARQSGFSGSDQHPMDPSLDVAYPLTWYPGTSDPDEAETLTLHAGDSRQADFQLAPVPAVHLHILPDTSANIGSNGRRIQSYPIVQRISSEGNEFVPLVAHVGPQGAVDVSGLVPGRYEVRMQGSDQTVKPAIVDITAGSTQTLDMSAASAVASVSVHLQGTAGSDVDSVQVNLIDPATGRSATSDEAGAYFLSGSVLHRRRPGENNRVLEVPPGRYEVVLNGNPNLFLTGITAQSAQAAGRFVTLPSGNSTLTLHVSEGRTTLTGTATIQGKPSVGAMVLLVPTTLGEPDSLSILRRDQTNTDGSFDLNNVLPGQYILLAIDNGWQVNWKDPATLRGYMMHGVPVDLTATPRLNETVEAQVP